MPNDLLGTFTAGKVYLSPSDNHLTNDEDSVLTISGEDCVHDWSEYFTEVENPLPRHLSYFYCEPKTLVEREAVKMAAELAGFGVGESTKTKYNYKYLSFSVRSNAIYGTNAIDELHEASVMDFINKFKLTDDEVRALDKKIEARVEVIANEGFGTLITFTDIHSMKIVTGTNVWVVSEDGKIATLKDGTRG